MRDFALCTDAGCPSRKSCRRFTDEPRDTRQNYADFQRGDKPNCWMFEPIKKPAEIEMSQERTAG